MKLIKKYLKITYNYLLDLTNKVQRVVNLFLSTILPLLGLTALLLVIYYFGFTTSEAINAKIVSLIKLSSLVFLVGYSLRLLFMFRLNLKLTVKKSEAVTQLFWVLLLFLYYLFFGSNPEHNIIFDFAWVFILFFLEFSKLINTFSKLFTNTTLLFLTSFLFVILVGTALLLLPNSTYKSISVIDALFTSTSAVCVTGLVVVDTHETFTLFGQIILLILIQIGGLGLMTFTTFFALLSIGDSSLKNDALFSDTFNRKKYNNALSILSKIILTTFGIEFLGGLLIYYSLKTNNVDGVSKLFFSIFHTISAFCNAGFSNIPDGLFNNVTNANYPFQIVIILLIISGGLGFPILFNFLDYLKRKLIGNLNYYFKKKPKLKSPHLISMNTKIVLIYSAILLFSGWFLFFFTEYNNELNLIDRIFTSLFASVTARTAGFNTFDMELLSIPSILIFIFLMWVGASPASTGGGVKTTTLAISLSNIYAFVVGKDRIELFGREIENQSIRKAFSIVILSFIYISIAVFVLVLTNNQIQLKEIVFEAFSAFSTVGLSIGATAKLNLIGKTTIIFTMFVGRIGAITLLLSLFKSKNRYYYKLPKENILIN